MEILVSGSRPVNRQIMNMLKRRVRVIESDWLWSLLHDMQGDAPKQAGRQGRPPESPMWLNLRHAGFMVEWDTWKLAPPQLSFTNSEH